ncbi:MAG: 30S ribosomal protein S16 [Candidatus Moranbacteria bacterium]|nr:30S ribosomal protein S16 [Candidatus Moranbacteria bacterium]
MLAIRLNRVGRHNRSQFRVVVQEHTVAPGGRHVAVVGSYDPHSKKGNFRSEEIQRWISNGAKPSSSVHNLLVRFGVLEASKVSVVNKKMRAGQATADTKVSEEIPSEKAELVDESVKKDSADVVLEEEKK